MSFRAVNEKYLLPASQIVMVLGSADFNDARIDVSGESGIASRFSIVPRSRSRVIARPVIITIVIVRITPINPGTMLYCVSDSGL